MTESTRVPRCFFILYINFLSETIVWKWLEYFLLFNFFLLLLNTPNWVQWRIIRCQYNTLPKWDALWNIITCMIWICWYFFLSKKILENGKLHQNIVPRFLLVYCFIMTCSLSFSFSIIILFWLFTIFRFYFVYYI